MPSTANPLAEEVLIRNGHFIQRVYTEIDLGSQDAYLRSLVQQQPLITPSLFKTGQNATHACRNTNGETILFTRLDALPFRSAFAVNGASPNLLKPTLHLKPEAGELSFKDNTFPWPAVWGDLFFIQTFVSFGVVNNPGNCHFVCFREGEFFHTYYPNIFSTDGRVCMGSEWERNKGGGFSLLQEQYMHSYMSFFSTQLNGDLAVDATFKLFARTCADGNPWRAHADPEWAERNPPSSIITARFFPLIGPFLTTHGYGTLPAA